MNWDPSMSTTSCNICGKGIEAWIDRCDTCEGEIVANAESKMGLSGVFQDGWLEAYDKHPDKMILKYSGGVGDENQKAAQLMRDFMDKNNVLYENDPECDRTIWIAEKDFNELFIKELIKKGAEE